MKTRLEWNEMKNRIQNSVFLAAGAMFGSLPMFHYQFKNLSGSIFTIQPTAEQIYYLSVCQSFMVFSLAFLCALVGFLYADRLKLPGFGKHSDVMFLLPVGLVLGLAFTPVWYFAFDREIFLIIPEIYPASMAWALASMMGVAISQEVIVRFGLLTIVLYFLDRWGFEGHPWPAIAIISTFGSFGAYLFMVKFNLAELLSSYQIAILLISAFFLQWGFCEVYLRKGLLAAFYIHFGLSVKYLIYAIMIRS